MPEMPAARRLPSSHRMKALITGGEGDLAQHIRAELESAGWEVLAPGRAELNVLQPQAFFAPIDHLDLLVNNAGIFRDGPLLQMTDEAFESVLDVNLKGAFLCTQVALKLMSRQRQGHIINIGSYSALSGPAGQANYAAAKAGLIALTQSTAQEYGSRNIRANCLLPGFLETRMTQHLLKDDEWKQRLLSQHTLGRLNTPQDAARFILMLHSMTAVSGQVFQLDSRPHRWT